MAIRNPALEDFIKPLRANRSTLHQLMREFCITFRHLAADSSAQFLPTPVFESTLRPVRSRDEGVYLAIDIGGSNLRVAFVQLFPDALSDGHGGSYANGDHSPHRYLRRIHEKAWPIGEHLKNENADQLFNWIGRCITQVVQVGKKDLSLHLPQEIPMGVAFSFPMAQECLSQATLMPMGKGFAITSNLDLGYHLLSGYEKNRGSLPGIRIVVILNDSVATMASFMYQNPETAMSKPVMGLIIGTGTNATIPMRLGALHQSKANSIKQPPPDQVDEDPKIAVNTEWSINGSVPPMRKLGLITRWDKEVDEAGEAPGFQPLEYMTAGRYLGELCRRVFVDYLISVRGYRVDALPEKMKTKFGVTTAFLSFYRPDHGPPLREQLNQEFRGMLEWTDDLALDLYEIALAAELRAALIIAAAIVALLQSAEYIPPMEGMESKDLVVGYTGGCITKFQRYLEDTQKFLQEVLEMEFGPDPPVKVLLKPCHDGGIEGAGILAGVSKGYPGR